MDRGGDRSEIKHAILLDQGTKSVRIGIVGRGRRRVRDDVFINRGVDAENRALGQRIIPEGVIDETHGGDIQRSGKIHLDMQGSARKLVRITRAFHKFMECPQRYEKCLNGRQAKIYACAGTSTSFSSGQ